MNHSAPVCIITFCERVGRPSDDVGAVDEPVRSTPPPPTLARATLARAPPPSVRLPEVVSNFCVYYQNTIKLGAVGGGGAKRAER
jgi:hypothetical protein